MLTSLLAGIESVMHIPVLLAIATGVGGGIILGAIPGLTAKIGRAHV